jgi:hypothetical protein
MLLTLQNTEAHDERVSEVSSKLSPEGKSEVCNASLPGAKVLMMKELSLIAGIFLQTCLVLLSVLLAPDQLAAVPSFESQAQYTQTRPAPNSPYIVIGFVGGFVKHDDSVHSGVQLAARLRADYPSGVYVEVFENRRREQAHAKILELLGSGHNGVLSDDERRNARIILYGMSWGGSETIELARELEKDRVPVLLTIQVDSVPKNGQNDRVIPANVAEAVNFYQTDGFLHGVTEIQAADSTHTHILGNYRSEYKSNPLDCNDYPWWDRLFVKQHTEIECDTKVWSQVEALIRAKLPSRGSAPVQSRTR